MLSSMISSSAAQLRRKTRYVPLTPIESLPPNKVFFTGWMYIHTILLRVWYFSHLELTASRISGTVGFQWGPCLKKLSTVILFIPDGIWWLSGNTHAFRLQSPGSDSSHDGRYAPPNSSLAVPEFKIDQMTWGLWVKEGGRKAISQA